MAGAVKMLARQVLRLIAVEVFQISLCHGACAFAVDVFVHQSHRRLGQDRQRGVDDVHPVAKLFFQQVRLVFPRNEHIALVALRKSHRRTACPGVQHRHVFVEIGHKGSGLGIAAVLAFGELPCGQIIPARTARCFGVGGDDLDVRAHQIIPILDALGVARAHDQHDGGGVGCAVVRQTLLPVFGNQLAVGMQGIHIACQSQRDHIGIVAIDHRAGLLARAAV